MPRPLRKFLIRDRPKGRLDYPLPWFSLVILPDETKYLVMIYPMRRYVNNDTFVTSFGCNEAILGPQPCKVRAAASVCVMAAARLAVFLPDMLAATAARSGATSSRPFAPEFKKKKAN